MKRPDSRMRWLAAAALLSLLVLGAPTLPGSGAAAAGPGVTRVEAEAIAASGSCWSILYFSRLSGGAGRNCYSPGDALVWTVTATQGDVVRLYGYRDSVGRGFRVQIDGGVWTEGILTGADNFSALFYTSPALSGGAHTVRLEWGSSSGGFTVDFYELEGGGTSGPTPTTAAPTTTTTTLPPAGPGVCPIAPADGHAAITEAIARCPNGSTVQFPTGAVYHQSDLVEVADRSNLIIDGGGSTFVNSAPNTEALQPNFRLLRLRNVTVRNMTVVGGFKLSGPRSLEAPSRMALNQRNSGFHVYGGDGVTIADVTVNDVFGDGVTVVPSNWAPSGMSPEAFASSEIPRNIRFQRLTVTRAARQCIGVTAAKGFWLEDSTLQDCWYGGVDIERDVPAEPQHDLHFLRNTFIGYNLYAITVTSAGLAGYTNGVEIRGNKLLTPGDSCLPPIIIGYSPNDPNFLLNVVVEDNEIKALYHGVAFDHVQGGSVRNNRIEQTAPDSLCGPPAGEPVQLTNSDDVVVAGNTTVGY